jgi:hypothetical protein
VLRLLLQFFHRPKIRVDPLLARRLERSRVLNPQFLGYLRDNHRPGRIARDASRSMRRRQAVATAVTWFVVLGFGWLVVESARALSVF